MPAALAHRSFSSRAPAPVSSAMGGAQRAGAGRGNAFAQQQAARAGSGPFRGGLNALLSEAFGQDVSGLSAVSGAARENEAIGAEASTEGRAMSFAADVQADALDPATLETVAHEVAHALAGGGSGDTTLDRPGDPGERAAETAGAAFRKWAEAGFEGPAPRLSPAFGGRARVHRKATSSTTVTGDPMLRKGSTGSLVSALQTLLNAHGASLAVDGIFGSHTDEAVRDFQQAHGLEVDGIVGPKTAAKLNGSSSSSSSSSGASSSGSSSSHKVTGSPMLSKGDSGSLVRTLQTLLNGFGGHLDVDGEFGSLTDAAVRGFQRGNGLEIDGVVGPKTAAKLYDANAKDIEASSSSSSATPYAGNDAYSDMREAVLAAARSHLGAPYYWGADGPSMFDCSGFVLYVLRQDTGLINWGDDTAGGIKNRLPATNNPQKGDLNFYSSGGSVQHVEMFTGSGTTEIGASGGGSHTYGNDPNAKVQYSDSSADSRTLSHGSIAGLIAAKQS